MSPTTKMYLMNFYGDLPTKASSLCANPRTFNTLDDALNWLKDRVTITDNDRDEYDDEITCGEKFWVDSEDDRIVIYEISVNEEHPVLVWHFSGWHWQHDASDLPGGPLDQGKLPGYDRSLYDLAIAE